MANNLDQKYDDIFRDFLSEVDPIRLNEPFAETLGAFKKKTRF